jgi:hypothetical protein
VVDKPTILRSRIWHALASRYPRGMTANQIKEMVINNAFPISELTEHLGRMVVDGLLAEAREPSRFTREPLRIFIAKGGRN